MAQVDLDRLRRVFEREETCVLGLPFDCVDEVGAVEILDQAVKSKQRCFLSTPNLNFAIAATSDLAFRESVFQSDLSVADGMPLIWLSRLAGESLPERVAGSSLFEKLRRRSDRSALSVFFFGGMGNVAEQATEVLNSDATTGMKSVGALNPGMGSVEDMSSGDIIERINTADPDFLVVSLGAKKGQNWILANKDRLNARVQSHLGAVVNFVAGTVERAPVFWQKIGLEWVWRILEEPSLWKRYFFDGLKFCTLLVGKAFPLAVYGGYLRRKYSQERLSFSSSLESECTVLSYAGATQVNDLTVMKRQIPELFGHGKGFVVDLRGLEYASSSFWAFLLRLRTESKNLGLSFRIENTSPRLKRLGKLHMLDDLFC